MTSDTTPVEGKIRVYVSDRSQAPPGATVKRDSDGDLYYDTADGYRGDPDRSFEVPVYDPEDITDPRVGTNTPETGVFDRDDWYGDDPGDIGLAGIACPLSELPVTRQEMQAIAADYKEWTYEEGPRGGDRWRNSETGEVVYDKPADAPAAPDDEEGTGAESSGRLSLEEAKDEIFYGAGTLDAEYDSEEEAAVSLIQSGEVDPETAATALIELDRQIDADGYGLEGRNKASDITEEISGPTEYAFDLQYKPSAFGYVRSQARKDFGEEYPEHFERIVDDATSEWKGRMFTEGTAPMFQVAADEMDNDTLPEGGAFGDDEHIPSVLETPTGYEERDAIRAKMEQTQSLLREAFGDTLPVYRGLSEASGNPSSADASEAPAKLAEAGTNGDSVTHEHRPAESWSADPGYASMYAKRGDRKGQPDADGALLRREVPVEQVLMSSHASGLATNESEIVVMHDEEVTYDADQIIADTELDNQTLIEEALQQAAAMSDGGVEQEAERGADAEYHIGAEEIDPQWLHEDPPGDQQLADAEQEATPLSDVPVTRQEMQAIAADYKEWTYEEGPRGGDRWRNSETGEVVYDKPADAPAAPDDEEGGDEAASGDYPSHEGNYALSEGDSRRIIENDSSAQLLADSFDTDDWEFDHWSTYPDSETVNEGTVIEVDDDEFPIVGGGQTATVIDPEENIAVTEFGDRVEFSHDPAAEGYAAIRAWDDQANRVASGDVTWDEYAPEYIPEEVQQNRTPENIAVDETDAEPEGEPWGAEGLSQYFEEEYGASTDGFEEGHLTAGAVELEGEFRQLNYDRLEGDIPHFIDEDNNFEYADVDGTACRYMRTDRFPGHGEVYCSFDGDVAEIDDGWYRQGDIIEREDGDGFYRELVDPDGNMTEVDLTEVGDGVIDNIYRPVEATEVASDITGVSEQFDDTYPEDPDLPDSLSPGELRNDLTDTQTDAIRSGMGKLNEVGFGDRINDVQHIEDSSFDRATEPIGMYDPVQETVHFNPEKISEEYLGGMSDDFSVGSGVEDTVVHEGVHAAHVEHLVENEGWDVAEIVDDLLEQNLDNGERMLIEEEVSEYAATNPLEVVAEIGTMLLNGEEPSEEALHLYEKYGGPTEFTEGAAVAEARRVATPVVSTKADGGAITPKEALLAEASAVRMTIHDFFTDDTVTQLSDVPVTAAEMDALTVEYKEWVPYQGPEGGDGWRNTDTDEIVYDDDPPGEIADTPQARGREVKTEATDILGDNPGRDEYAEVEAYLEDELAVENVDVSDFDAQQVEITAAELGRLDAQGDLDGLSEINSQVPEQARETYGDLPMHYDRDGEAVSINPQAMTGDMAGALAGDGVISTADAEHFLRHMVGTHKHAEAVENGDTDPEGDPSESAEQQLSEEGFDTQDIARSVGTLALATGVTLVAETWALLEGGKQPSDAALQAYRYFGGPTLSGVTGENE